MNKNVIDIAAEITGAKNDAALGKMLGIHPPVISKYRNGVLPVGAMFVIKMHELTGIPTRGIRATLGVKIRGLQ